jgi:hypothetical protein
VLQVRKNARVVTSIKIKAGEIKGDLVDVYGQAADLLPGLLAMPAELLYRTSWAASGALNVPVVDWEECKGGWYGTITRTTKYRKDEPVETRHSTTHTGYDEWTEKLELIITGEQDTKAGLTNGYFAAGKIVFDQTVYSKSNDQKFSCTERRGRISSLKSGKKIETYEKRNKADMPADTTVYIMVIGNRGTLDFHVPDIKGESFYKETFESPCSEANRNGTKSGKSDYPFERIAADALDFVVEADPNNPDALHGSRTVKNSDGSESIYTWDLVRCANVN